MTINEWRALREHTKRQDRDAEPSVLAPPKAFSDETPSREILKRFHWKHDPHQLSRHSRAVSTRLGSSCCGWRKKPTAAEFYDAIRARTPNTRQKLLILTWLQEATKEDFLYAWVEGVYTWRELARAIHAANQHHTPRCADLNTLVSR